MKDLQHAECANQAWRYASRRLSMARFPALSGMQFGCPVQTSRNSAVLRLSGRTRQVTPPSASYWSSSPRAGLPQKLG